jgi:hypothetical protein
MNHENRVAKGKRVKSNLIFSIKKIKNQKKWTKEEDEQLISLAEKYSEKNWKEISKRFVKKNSLQCFSRYKRIRPGIIKGSWKKEEDARIIELVNKHGKAWSKISKVLGTRNGKQIRDRYINVLDPEIRKGKFTEEEDNKLIQLFKQHGPKWATIAKYYPNRTADMIKNRFHSSIKKRLSGDSIDKLSKDDTLAIKHEMSSTSEDSLSSVSTSRKSYSSQPFSRGESNPSCVSNELFFEQGPGMVIDTHNFNTNFTKDIEADLFIANTNLFNYEFGGYDNVKNEDVIYGGELNFNFEDYFTI